MIVIRRSEYELVIDLYYLFTALFVCTYVCRCESVCSVQKRERGEAGDKKRARAKQRRKTSILNSKISRRLQSKTYCANAMFV